LDNLAHTLVGIALADAGLKRRTAFGTATLAIGANLPDVDVLVYTVGTGVDALAFRRGWTHGILAMVVLPLLLAALTLCWDRLVRGRRSEEKRAAVRGGWLVALAAVGIWSHPLLDLLNTYGVRLLMPFSGRWFYGDTLFIIDPWLWLALSAGIIATRWREHRAAAMSHEHVPPGDRATRPVRVALAALSAYVLVMAGCSSAGRATIAARAPGSRPARTMVAPLPVSPLVRDVVRDLVTHYERGTLRFGLSPHYSPQEMILVGWDAPGVAEAARTHDGAAFLLWSRFPRFTSARAGDSIRVRMSDVRYTDANGEGWASVVVTVPLARAARRW
jgi:inner membrane protein